MNLRLHYPLKPTLLGGLLAGAGLLGGCRHEAVTPVPVVDYYPLAVGTYRAYAVTDTLWRQGQATATAYQLREAISGQFADAAGQPAYRVVRARRPTAADAWVEDSVLVVQTLPQAVLLTRDNVRTVELIYPLQPAKAWRKYAFTTTREDSVRAFDAGVGQAFTAPPTPGAAGHAYPATATVRDVLPASANDGVYRQGGYLQVFAQGVGPVLRRRYAYETFISQNNGAQTLTPGVIQVGHSRLEVLIDSGKL